MNNIKTPLISVITVSYNAKSTIEETILSVINQKFEDYEYIIVDGGSTDGTVDIIKEYQDKITFWSSEPDKGIYDAMNKGINFSSGKWCYFMNAGDSFYNVDILKNIKQELTEYKDVVYGSINCITKLNSFILEPKPVERIYDSMIFCHQAVFVEKIILDRYNFDISFKIAADYKLFRQLFFLGYKFNEVDIVVANYEAEEGISSTNFYGMFKEYAIIMGKWDGLNSKGEVFLRVIKHVLFRKISKMIPLKWKLLIKEKIY